MSRSSLSVRIATVVLLLSVTTVDHSLAGDNDAGMSLTQAYEQVVTSVVFIEVGTPEEKTGSGSGVILHRDGYIATAAHVVDRADKIRVTFHDESSEEAQIVTMSRLQDLALLRVKRLPRDTHTARLADSDTVKSGEPVFCIGAPHDLAFTVTKGIVSAIRADRHHNDYMVHQPTDLLQTDTPINPGNSGGPVFNRQGQVIGLAVKSRLEADGISFAVTSNLVRRYLFEEAVPFAGVVFIRVPPKLAAFMNWMPQEVLLVERVQKDSIAMRGGLRGGHVHVDVDGFGMILGGDLIVKIGDHPVSDYQAVEKYLRGQTLGDEVQCTVLRHGKLVTLTCPWSLIQSVPQLDSPGESDPGADSEPLASRTGWLAE